MTALRGANAITEAAYSSSSVIRTLSPQADAGEGFRLKRYATVALQATLQATGITLYHALCDCAMAQARGPGSVTVVAVEMGRDEATVQFRPGPFIEAEDAAE